LPENRYTLNSPQQPFTYRVDPHGAERTLKLSGELDLSVGSEFQKALDAIAADRPTRVVVDLREVTFIDSSGLRMLLQANSRAHNEGWEISFLPKERSQVRRALEVTGLHRVFPMADGARADV
jgi:anti-anti-sigma factor